MAFASTEETDSITKMLEAIQTMEKYGKTLNEMKTRVEEKLSRGRERAKEQEASFILSEARDEDERKRKVLLDFCTKIKDFLDKIDEKDSNLVKVHLGNVQEEMKSHMTQLQQKEYYILVAGETCAGKTTVVNLILGETLLPYSALRTTSTICEVRYGEERKLVVHFKDKDPETGQLTKTIFLEEPTGSPEKSYLSQISPYVHWNGDDEQSPVFEKTEIFWPHSLLQKGIVIIDSPGVGESDYEIDQMVIQYLPQAFAFIYVINSTNGGGIQKDRLVKLLLDVQELPLGFQEQTLQQRLLSKCALFVFNKWDQIDTNERETFRDRVTKKLQKLSPGIDPESQMIYISAKGAALAQNYGYATEDLSSLVSHMKTLVEKSIETRLEIHWRWLNFRVSEIIVEAKMYMMNASRNREEASRKLAKVICRLKEIEKQKRKVGPALRESLNECVRDMVQQLSESLSYEKFQASFTSWTSHELPVIECNRDIKYHIREALLMRWRKFIKNWKKDNKVRSNAHHCLLQAVQERYTFFEEELQNIQAERRRVTADDGCLEEDIADSASLQATSKLMVFGMSSFHVVRTFFRFLQSDVSIPPRISWKKFMEGWHSLWKKEEDKLKCAQLTEVSKDFLAMVSDKSELEVLVRAQFREAQRWLEQLESHIPKLIQEEKMRCQDLMNDKRSKKELQDLYQPIVNEGSKIRGQLQEFGIKEILVPDIASEELQWKEDRLSLIGQGTFATVYQGTITRNGNVKTVALKVCGGALDAQNACILIEEVETLRKLNHPNIVKFYGTSLLKERDTVTVILVMEKCKGDLKNQIKKDPKSFPGQSEDPGSVRVVGRWVVEIVGALDYIHSQGIVHRDLKPGNILLSDENAVKIADVGLAKQAANITGTYVGTPAYMAPEVFHSRAYDSKADMYSLGILLWEMWYGQRFPVPVETPTELFTMVDGGYRPGDVEGCRLPPDCWKELMERCWQGNPEKRPTAESCKNEAKMIVSLFENTEYGTARQ